MTRILAVDDSEHNLVTISLHLREPGFDVEAVRGGGEAIERAATGEFDLVLLDVDMPGMDGFEICRRLKADPRTRPLPVIFLTGEAVNEADRLRGYEIGAADYITNPVKREELIARIRTWLRIRDEHARRERENLELTDKLQAALRDLSDLGERLSATEDLAAATGEPGAMCVIDAEGVVRGADPCMRQLCPELVTGSELPAGGLGAALRLAIHASAAAGAAVPFAVEQRFLEVRATDLGDGETVVVLRDLAPRRAIEGRLASRKPAAIPAMAVDTGYRVRNMIGSSAEMKRLSGLVDRLRRSRSTVLVCGESGTGKELVARALHFDGPFASRAYVPFHCGAISPDLVESELFGYVKGAFTGAMGSKHGLFKEADGGTVFLDEVAEMSLDLQVKLLRVLQLGEIRPVGAVQPQHVDVRIIAATNQDLQRFVREGRFREDLFYRLEVVTIDLPPLRDRVDDIPQLAHHFLGKCTERHRGAGRRITSISGAALERLEAYPWPGNVRELENVIERAFALGVGELLQLEDLPDKVVTGNPSLRLHTVTQPGERTDATESVDDATLRRQRDDSERRAIIKAIDESASDMNRAAVRLGVSRSTLYRRCQLLGIPRGRRRSRGDERETGEIGEMDVE